MARRKRSIAFVEKELGQRAVNDRQTREPTRRRKSPQTTRFSNYVFKVLKQVHPQLSMTNKAMKVMDDFMHDIYSRLVSEAAGLVKLTKKSTLSASEFQTATRLILPGELAKHAISEASKAVANFLTSRNDDAKRSHARRVINNPPTNAPVGANNQEPVEIEIFGTGPRPPVISDTEPIKEDEIVKHVNSIRKFTSFYPSKDNQTENRKSIHNATQDTPDNSFALPLVDKDDEMSEENISDEESTSANLDEPGPPTPPTEVESDVSISTSETPPVETETEGSTSKPEMSGKSGAENIIHPKLSGDEGKKKLEDEEESLPIESQPVDSQDSGLLVVVNVEENIGRSATVKSAGSLVSTQMIPSSDAALSTDTDGQLISVTVQTGRLPEEENEAVMSSTSNISGSETVEPQSQLTVRCSTVTSTKTTLIHELKEKVSEWFTG